MKSLRLDRICLLAAGLSVCAVLSHAQPAMSRGQQFLQINYAECLTRATQALRNVGFSANTSGNFAQGFKDTSGAYIICNDSNSGTPPPSSNRSVVVNIVVASGTNDAGVPGQLRQLLQAQMQQPGSGIPPPSPPSPAGASGNMNIAGNWLFAGDWPFSSLQRGQQLILQQNATGGLSGGSANKYVFIPTDPQAMWGCDGAAGGGQVTSNSVLICLHPSNWNSSIKLAGDISMDGSAIIGTARHGTDSTPFTLRRVAGGGTTLPSVTTTAYPNVGGTWYREGNTSKPASIQQNGGTLRLVNEAGQASRAHFQNGAIVADDWNGLVGTIVNGGRRINWANNSSWQR